MCILFAAIDCHKEFPVIICANRDEFYKRNSTEMQWHTKNGNDILSGIDLEAGGTWLGLNKLGHFCAVTNIRGAGVQVENPRTRGELPINHLIGNSVNKTNSFLEDSYQLYSPFNLWYGNLIEKKLTHYNSVQNRFEKLGKGFHVVSNSEDYDRWPKMTRGISRLKNLIADSSNLDEEALLNILTDSKQAEDHELPQTGIPYEWEKRLSSIFIKSKDYGTRASTILFMNRKNQITTIEQRFGISGINLSSSKFTYSLIN